MAGGSRLPDLQVPGPFRPPEQTRSYETIIVKPPTSNAQREIEIVKPGIPIYGVLVEGAGIVPIALLLGRTNKTPIRVTSGDYLDLSNPPENRGLYALWTRINYDARLTVTVFYQPTGFSTRRLSIWDLADRQGAEIQIASAAGQRAGAAVNNYTPADHRTVLGTPADLSERLVRLDQLEIWANIGTQIRIVPCTAQNVYAVPPPTIGSRWQFPVIFGVQGMAELVGGIDPNIPAGALKLYPVQMNQLLSLDDLEADIETGMGIAVRIEDAVAATLTVMARWREHICDYMKG